MIEPFDETTEEQVAQLRHAVNFFEAETLDDLGRWIRGEKLDEAESWIAKRSVDEIIEYVRECAWHDHPEWAVKFRGECVACDMQKPYR